jgi:hypothetical protein
VQENGVLKYSRFPANGLCLTFGRAASSGS